jgi:hypothetical protein
MLFLNNAPVSTKSKMQSCVTLSVTESQQLSVGVNWICKLDRISKPSNISDAYDFDAHGFSLYQQITWGLIKYYFYCGNVWKAKRCTSRFDVGYTVQQEKWCTKHHLERNVESP